MDNTLFQLLLGHPGTTPLGRLSARHRGGSN
jgi:hypothetical protein